MPRKPVVGNLALTGYEDIFNISTIPADGEQVEYIPLTELFPPELHPFQVKDDEAMLRLAESIKEHGVLSPGFARPRVNGGYELLSGNRRKRACELAELTNMPVKIRELDDDTAALIMVSSNLEQRESILPSELAWSYKVMLDALNHNGIKGEQHSYEIITERTGVKKNQLFRYIRLTELITELIDKVDVKQLAFNPAVELSYLSVKEQTAVAKAMAEYEVRPSLSQAIRLKKLKQSGEICEKVIVSVLAEIKNSKDSDNSSVARYSKYFPSDYSHKQMDAVIVSLLKDWKTKTAAN